MSSIDLSFLELLSSKICHDLISPIGAINNGLEILEEMGAADNKEVLDLIAFSAAQASAKLKAFRMAYGAGGADSNIKIADVHKTIQDIVGAEKKIVQDWSPHIDLGYGELPRGFCKILTSGLLLAMECLPKGGRLSVVKDSEGTRISAHGEDAGLRGNAADALTLAMPVAQIEPKYVHAYMTGLLAKHYGIKIDVSSASPSQVDFLLSAPV